jgi:hypothetical protein
MWTADRDLAIAACEGAVSDAVRNIASVLLRDLAASETDDGKAEVKQKFERGLAFYKDAHQLLRSLVDSAYPGT